MSLTEALTIFGGLLIAALIAHNVWNSRRNGIKQAEPAPAEGDAGDEAQRHEPVLDGGGSALDALSPTPEQRPMRRRIVARLDALIDALATISVEQPVAAEQALAHLPPSRRAGTKPLLVEGLNSESGEWEHPAAGQRYGEFQAGVQLANRGGALNEIEYSEFVQKVELFAEGVGGTADFPDMLDAVARARELDNFASQHDAQLELRLRSRGAAWSAGYIQQYAMRHGFHSGVVPGRLILPADEEGGPPVLALRFDPQAALAEDPSQAAVREVLLDFDVPQTDAESNPFETWQKVAEALAQEMDADIVDDHGRPLAGPSFAAIGGELGKLYAALDGHDLSAGSNSARRLFS